MNYKQIDEQIDNLELKGDWCDECKLVEIDTKPIKKLARLIYDQAKAEQREIDALIAENYVKQWKFPKDSNAKIHYTTVGNEIAKAIRED